jgi:hypothetical protein
MIRWLGGGRVPTPYNDEFFFWWHQNVIAIEEYPYVGINYIGDTDMPFRPGPAYDDIGMNFFLYFIFLCFFEKSKNCKYFFMGSTINNSFFMQMWVLDGQMDSHDIDRGTEEMSMWGEM